MKIIVASTNPTKINSVQQGFAAFFAGMDFSVEGCSLSLQDLPDQPMGDQETRNCAYERIKAVKQTYPDADVWCGIEGGLTPMQDRYGSERLDCFAWIVFENAQGETGEARTATFSLPKAASDLIAQGLELGDATDMVFNLKNTKHDQGLIGMVTNGLIDRTEYYVHAVILALVPFKNALLYRPKAIAAE